MARKSISRAPAKAQPQGVQAVARINGRIRLAWFGAHKAACRIEALARLGANAGDEADQEDLAYLLEAIRDIAMEIQRAMDPIDQVTRADGGPKLVEATNG